MLPGSVGSSMSALLHQAHQRQQFAAAAAMMASGSSNTNSNNTAAAFNNINNATNAAAAANSNRQSNALTRALDEEVGRRKAVMAGTPYSITKQFPFRLHEMLDLVEEEGLEEVVSFLPDGRSFKVHNPTLFEKGLMRRCFNQTVSITVVN